MSESPTENFFGSPRFADAELRAVEQRDGPAAAWREALRRSPDVAAANAQGHFAVWLTEPNGRTFLAVDRFATHTLCYRVEGDRLLVSERADKLAGARPSIDPQAIFDYLYFHEIPSPKTIYSNVFRLPPGHFATFEQGKLHVAPYWTPSFDERPVASFESAKAQFHELLNGAVTAQLDGTRPAAFLSGGTDSSTVAGMMRQVTGQAPATYSIGFEAEGYDEMEYARLAAKHFGTEHHEYYVTPDDLVRGVPLMAQHLDQPFGNSSAVPAYLCALRAREDGITHMLAGDGGDEVFGGNTRYAKQRVFGWYDEVPAVLRSAVLNPLTDSKVLDRIPLLSKGSSYIRQARVPMPDRLQTYNLLKRLGIATMFTEAFIAKVNCDGPAEQETAVWRGLQGMSGINRMLAYDWRFTLAENDLPKVRAGTSLAGVSVGYPFLDQRLVDFAGHLPSSYKLRGLKLRWFFKEALRGFLPDEIITKKKHGFGLPFGVWANQNPGLKRLARDSLSSFVARGLINPEFTRALLDEHLPAHPGYYGEMVWILLMLEQWFMHHAPDWRLEA